MKTIKVVVAFLTTLLTTTNAFAADFAYGEALQKSIYFYEAQQAGKLPSWNRVPWRGDSVLNDGEDVGIDLSGGWFDAGDHVKFGFPMSSTATMLAWGAIDYEQAFISAGQMDEFKNNLKFVNDYFIAAHPTPNEFYGQVGLGGPDHSFWVPAEVIDQHTRSSRVSAKIDLNCKGPDLASETAAAMAASSMVFKNSDSAYSATLLQHAKQLYSLALATTGMDGKDNGYSKCITDSASFYNSAFGLYWDEMAWGALWLYRATGKNQYLTNFNTFYSKMGFEDQSTTPVFTWGQGWNDKAYGVYVMAARLLGDQKYHTDARRWLDHWISPSGGLKTNGGLVVVDRFNGWGTARYAANMAYLALYYADGFPEGSAEYNKYHNFGKRQIDYILGDNPRSSSYVVGFGASPPVNVHHRGSHGSWARSEQVPAQQRHILYGAVVGGPASADDFDYVDNRSDFKRNEVATDYNSGFNSAVAALYGKYGGDPIPDAQFPPAEGPFEEYLVGAKRNGSANNYIEIKTVLQNKSTAPAKARDDLYFRYFVDLSELQGTGLSASDVTVTAPFNQGSGVSQLKPWGDSSDNLYYAEVRFDGVVIYPGGQSEFRREVQFRLALPTSSGVAWDSSNDPSWDNAYNTTSENFGVKAPKIPVYGAEGLLFGVEPSPACGGGSGINCLPTAQGSSVTTAFQTAVIVSLAGSDSDGSIVSRTITQQPTNGSLTSSGQNRTYTPNAGFSGADSFAFTVTDNQGGVSAPATVNITVEAAAVPSVDITSPANGSNVSVGSNFTLNFTRQNAVAVKVSVAGTVVANNVTGNSISLTAPSSPGSFTVVIEAVDSSGSGLGVTDSVSLNATQVTVNQPPTADFSFSTNELAVNFDGNASDDPDNGPQALSYTWDFGDASTGSGVSPSHTYAADGTYTVQLTVSDGQDSASTSKNVTVAKTTTGGGVTCEYLINNEWNSGFVASIKLTNNGSTAVNGWQVSWQYAPGTDRSNGWNANVTGSNPYTATNLPWNGVIQPGQSVEFGMQGTKPFNTPAEIPAVTGAICN